MELDKFYIFLCIIVLIGSFLSPAIVAAVNNCNQRKLRKLAIDDKNEAHSREIIDGYFRTAGTCLHTMNAMSTNEFGKYRDLIYLYMPAEFHDDISMVNDAILDHNSNGMLDSFLDDLAVKYSQKCRDK